MTGSYAPAAWRVIEGGVLVVLRVTPNAAADRIDGVETRDDGTAVLRVRVRAVPDKGKANAAVIALVAKALGVPRSAVALTAGETSRQKTLRIAGEAETLGERLAALTATGE